MVKEQYQFFNLVHVVFRRTLISEWPLKLDSDLKKRYLLHKHQQSNGKSLQGVV